LILSDLLIQILRHSLEIGYICTKESAFRGPVPQSPPPTRGSIVHLFALFE
jgi:hypothetical protein